MKRGVRPWLLLAHRWMGLALSAVLLVAGLTGSLLAFDDALDAWLNPGLFRETGAGPTRPLAEMIRAAEDQDTRAKAVRILFPTPDRQSFLIGVAARDPGQRLGYNEVFVDPATGRVLGRRDTEGCCFAAPVLMPFLFRLHYTLALGETGEMIMGGAAMLWCLDCVVGLLLTFPRGRPFLRHWRTAWLIKRGVGSFRLVFDWHRAGGLWCWGFLLLIAISGVALTLRDPVFLPVVKALLPVSPDVSGTPAAHPIGLAEAAARAGQVMPERRPADLYFLPGIGLYGVSMAAAGEGDPWSGLGPDTVWVAADDGHIVRIDRAGQRLAGDTLLEVQYPLHSGRIAGLPSRILVAILGLAVAMLSLTGPWIWWRKRRTPKSRQR